MVEHLFAPRANSIFTRPEKAGVIAYMPASPYGHHWRVVVRPTVLARDGGICQIRGPRCLITATEADHIVPWRDGGAWYDLANLRAACKPCNIRRSNLQKAHDGWRRSDTRIVLVVGPVGAGKSTYVEEHAGVEDVVIDYDAISQALGPTLPRGSEIRHDVVMAARGAVLDRVRRGEVDASTVWIVSSNPEAEAMFPYHEAIVVDPGRDEVLRRGIAAGRPEWFEDLVHAWYAARSPAPVTSSGRRPSREW